MNQLWNKWILLAVLGLALPAHAQNTVLVTKIAGQTGAHYVTTREVQINFVVDQVFSLGRTATLAFLKVDTPQFMSELQDVMMEWAVYLEATSFASQQATKNEVDKTMGQIESALKDLPAWKALEVGDAELRLMVQRKLMAREFMQLKTDSSLVPVSDTEAMAYYRKNRLKFGNMPFSAFRENIRTFLVKQQMDRRLKDWFDVLSRKYKIRNLLAG